MVFVFYFLRNLFGILFLGIELLDKYLLVFSCLFICFNYGLFSRYEVVEKLFLKMKIIVVIIKVLSF